MKYFLIVSLAFFSLLLGSFFTVLVYRLPLMLQQQWRKDAQQF